jgi:hypothetical protein
LIIINPFAEVSQFVPSIVMQAFVVLMVVLVVVGTFFEMLHKKNFTYFFQNAKKAKLSATKTLGVGEKASIVIKTVATDVLSTAELGAGQRRIAHVLGMWGTILFWTTSAIMIFCYSTIESETPLIYPLLWHLGAIMTCVGGYWFWFFLRVDVSAEGYPWYRIVRADLFVLSLLITATLGLMWSYLQSKSINGWDTSFLILFALSNLILFGGIYWSKFAHMFYKPGAAIQKRLAEADGSNENLPYPTDKPKQFGLGIKREAPKHY